MNPLSFVLFAHVVGMLGLFVALGLEGAGLARGTRELETPRLYRGSLALVVLSGGFLSRGLLSSSGLWELGWLVISLPALAVVAATGNLPLHIRSRVYTLRIALALGIVLLMIGKPHLDASSGIMVFAAIAGAVASIGRRRDFGVRAAAER